MPNKNTGILIAPPRPADYILGEKNGIPIESGIFFWTNFIPDFEKQYNTKGDFLICVTMSGLHAIETQLNYLMSKGLQDEFANFLKRAGYIINGKIKFSDRYNAKMNGTDKLNGQYQNIAGDHFRSDGFLPESIWPTTPNMTWQEYYSEIPDSIKFMAQLIKQFIDIKYQWIPVGKVIQALSSTPVQVATEVCDGWDSGEVVGKCSGRPVQHATMIYGIDGNANWLDFDQYPPFLQRLAVDYDLLYNMQYIVTLKPMCLRINMDGMNVLDLQKNLIRLGYSLTPDGAFGPHTQDAVITFQKANGLTPDGIAGPMTLKKIEDLIVLPSPKSKIDLWCEAAQLRENAPKAWNNPGALEYNAQPGTIGKGGPNNRFALFDTYEDGYIALKKLIVNACTGKSLKYNMNGNLYNFYAIYAPDSDGNNSKDYAEYVAEHIGVSPTTAIKNLLV